MENLIRNVVGGALESLDGRVSEFLLMPIEFVFETDRAYALCTIKEEWGSCTCDQSCCSYGYNGSQSHRQYWCCANEGGCELFHHDFHCCSPPPGYCAAC